MASVVEEGVSGIRVVKAFGREDLEVAKVDRVADRIYAKTMELVRERATFVPLFEVIPSLATVAVLWLGGLRVADGVMSLACLLVSPIFGWSQQQLVDFGYRDIRVA